MVLLAFAPRPAAAQFVCVNGAASTGGSAAAVGNVACGLNNTASTFGGTAESSAVGIGNAAGSFFGQDTAIGDRNVANGGGSTAIGLGNTASDLGGTAIGRVNTASGGSSLAMGFQNVASGSGAVAMGGNARASADSSLAIGVGNAGATASGISSIAVGNTAIAGGANSISIGTNSTANFANSAAFGQGATVTFANQQVFGTATNTYTTPGITSAASKAAQSGPLQLVTSDAGGNLATSTLADLGLASSADISGINSRLNDLTDRSNKAYTGVAMAFAMAGVPTLMPNERFAVTGNWGTFQGTNGLAFNAAARITNNIQLNGGIGYGANQNLVGGRVGVRVGW
jgi:YadA-like membrane anchor domain/Head domain of trimeric autotransporter adhesin